MKKKISVLVIIACLVITAAVMLRPSRTEAQGAVVKVESEAGNIKKGNEFNVSISVSSDTPMRSVDALITYDPAVLEYVPDNDISIVGADGYLGLKDVFEAGANEKTYTIRFAALETGESNIVVSNVFIDSLESGMYLEVSSAQTSVAVKTNRSESREARLSDLLTAPVMIEDFDPDTFEYTVNVSPEDAENVVISAVPFDENAVVTVERPEELVLGTNEIIIIVTAGSGDVKSYILTIEVGEIEETETESESEPEETETEETEEPETEEPVTETETEEIESEPAETEPVETETESEDIPDETESETETEAEPEIESETEDDQEEGSAGNDQEQADNETELEQDGTEAQAGQESEEAEAE